MKSRSSKLYPVSGRQEGKNTLWALNYVGPMLQTAHSPGHWISTRTGLLTLCLATYTPVSSLALFSKCAGWMTICIRMNDLKITCLGFVIYLRWMFLWLSEVECWSVKNRRWTLRNLLLAWPLTSFMTLDKSLSFSGLYSTFWKTVV